MSNLLDSHAKKLKIIVGKYARPVIFTNKTGQTYPSVNVIWNDVEHGLKMENFEGEPMGNKSSIFIDADTLNTLEFTPDDGWKVTGSPNNLYPVADYFIEIPKDDNQLPAGLYFLSKDQGTDAGWNKGDL